MAESAAPGSHVVIALRPAPAQPHVHDPDVAQIARRQRLFYPAHGFIMTVLEDGKYLDLEFGGEVVGRRQLVGPHEGRLLDDHVLAIAAHDVHRVFGVHARRRDDGDDVDAGNLGQHPVIIDKVRNAVLAAYGRGFILDQIANGDDISARNVPDRTQMVPGDAAAADQGDLDGGIAHVLAALWMRAIKGAICSGVAAEKREKPLRQGAAKSWR